MMSCCETPVEKVHAPTCGACGNKAHRVKRLTVEHMICGERQYEITDAQYYFCGTPDCNVIYFSNQNGQYFTKSDVRVRVGLKEKEDPVPICYCFDFTEAMVLAELLANGHTMIPALISSRIKAGHCACEVKNPSGRCCLGEVNKAVKQIEGKLIRKRESVKPELELNSSDCCVASSNEKGGL
jgi:hypothetical protein